jgi:hypothetical protein
MVGNVNVMVESVNKGIHSIFWTAKVVWKGDIVGFISVFTMANLQLPSCKVDLFFNMNVKTHVLMKVKNCNMVPQDRPFNRSSHNLSPGTFENNWQDLLKVTTKNNGKTTKGLFRVVQLPKGAINCLHNMSMLHGSLIPNDQVLGIGMGALDYASHLVGEQSGAGESKVSGLPRLDVPYLQRENTSDPYY